MKAKIGNRREIEHFVMSITVGQLRVHGYLMAADRRFIERVSEEMLGKAEEIAQEAGWMMLPIILMTGPLEPATTRRVRAALCDASDEVARVMQEATKLHRTVFVTRPGDPLDKLFMELH